MMFDPYVMSHQPERLDVYPSIVELPAGESTFVKIKVQNSSQHDIWLASRPCQGSTESVVDRPCARLPYPSGRPDGYTLYHADRPSSK